MIQMNPIEANKDLRKFDINVLCYYIHSGYCWLRLKFVQDNYDCNKNRYY